jgi:hypothetical protein
MDEDMEGVGDDQEREGIDMDEHALAYIQAKRKVTQLN